MKRSSLIKFLKDLEEEIKMDHNISKIQQKDQTIKITFENNEIYECDYLIISDGLFKVKSDIKKSISASIQ